MVRRGGKGDFDLHTRNHGNMEWKIRKQKEQGRIESCLSFFAMRLLARYSIFLSLFLHLQDAVNSISFLDCGEEQYKNSTLNNHWGRIIAVGTIL